MVDGPEPEGVQSALNQQNAKLLGGHTLVARDQSPSIPAMGLQLTLIVNGKKIQRSNSGKREPPNRRCSTY